MALDDEQINSSEGLLVLGYGDADNNGWSGAGSTERYEAYIILLCF